MKSFCMVNFVFSYIIILSCCLFDLIGLDWDLDKEILI